MVIKKIPKNPYIPGQPVKSKEMFFGREDLFEFLQQRLVGAYQDNVVMLYGQRRTGKTSILYQIRDAERLGSNYVPVLISLEGLQDVETNAWIFLEIARFIARALRLDPPDEKRFDPANSYFRHDFLETVKERLQGRKLLLMIDEYEVLEACVDNPNTSVNITLFHQLRYLMQHFEWLSFLLVGSHKLDELNPAYWKEFTGTIYQTISFLDSKSARQLIQNPALKESVVYTLRTVERLLELSGNHPYFLQSLCQTAFERGAVKGEVDDQDVEQAIESCILSIRNGYESIWREFTDDEKIILATISGLDAPEAHISDIAGQLGYLKVDWKLERINQAIRQLVYKDILRRNGGYRYCVPFFEKCVKTYHPLDRLLDDLGLKRWVNAHLVADPKILRAEQYLRQAEEETQRNNVELAKHMFEAATKVSPDYVDGWLRFGKFYEARQEKENALKIYKDFLKRNPDSVEALNAIGLLLKKSHQYDEALQQFQHSLKIRGDDNVALANIDEINQWFARQRETLQNISNPYSFGTPVRDKRMFYGRERLLDRLLSATTGLQSVSLVGPRRIGKTSLLYNLKQSLPPGYVGVFLDMQAMRHLVSIEKVIFYIAQRVSKEIGWDNTIDYETFSSEPYSGFDIFLDSLFGQQSIQGLILIFDEIDLLVEADYLQKSGQGFFSYLRSLVSSYPLTFIMAGVKSLFDLTYKDNSLFGSPFFNIFVTMQVDLLDVESCQALITDPVHTYLSYTSEAIERITMLSGRHPYVIQAFCHELVEFARSHLRASITVDDVDDVSPQVVKGLHFFFRYLWGHLTEDAKSLLKDTLVFKQEHVDKGFLKYLEENHIITIEENRPVLQMKLFELWLKEYQPWGN